MLKIKLSRFGKRNQPHYRIVVNEARDKRDGSYVESLGHYAPAQSPKLLELNLERYHYWIKQGAQPTETVAFLAEIAESGQGFPEKKTKKNKSQKKKSKSKKDKTQNKNSDKKQAADKQDKQDQKKQQSQQKEKKQEKTEDKS